VPRSLRGAVALALAEAGVRTGDGLVVAVSGGVDSMCLLHALAACAGRGGLRLVVAHVHHGLRGRSADRDAASVVAAAERLGLPYALERLDGATRAPGTSVQVWAREQRYRVLEAVRRRVNAEWVATAHNQNDQAETLLLNLLRGTGPKGLAGIPLIRGRILRPLLAVSRGEVEAYRDRYEIGFREDPSNRSDVYRRNRLRHRLLPQLLREYNPRLVESLAALAGQAREDEEALTAVVERLAAGALCTRGSAVGLTLADLAAAPPAIARRLLQEAYGRAVGVGHGLTRRHLAALASLALGAGRVRLPGGVAVSRAGGLLWFEPLAGGGPSPSAPTVVATPEAILRPGRWTRWRPGGCMIRERHVAGRELRVPGDDPARELLSPVLLAGTLRLRGWRPGDRFQPLGLRGAKKLQDFFVDTKIPRGARARIPLLVAGDRIAWVVGVRIADPFRWSGEPSGCLAEVRWLEGST
jgi:tRNA(Ile)-lysidine synthase